MLGNTTTPLSEASFVNFETSEIETNIVRSKSDQNFEMDIHTILYIQEEDVIELGFDTADYLSTGFDPCTVYEDLSNINYTEEDVVDLGFDTEVYLPSGFNANTVYEDLSDIAYVEEAVSYTHLTLPTILLV